MAENPATWRPLEHAISTAIAQHHMLTGFDHSGKSLERRIVSTLFQHGLMAQRDTGRAEAVCRATLTHIRDREAEHPYVAGLSHEAQLANALRAAKLVEERVEGEVADDSGTGAGQA